MLEVIDKEMLGGAVKKYIKVECPNCSYFKENPLKNGWSNYANHYTACVGKGNVPALVACQIVVVNDSIIALVLYGPFTPESKSNSNSFIIDTDKQSQHICGLS